ncbi:hypothetical protein D3C72_2050350 [compost metagenome]
MVKASTLMWVPRNSHSGRKAAMAMDAPISISSMSPRIGVENSLRPMIEISDMLMSSSKTSPPARAKPWVT